MKWSTTVSKLNPHWLRHEAFSDDGEPLGVVRYETRKLVPRTDRAERSQLAPCEAMWCAQLERFVEPA